MQSFPIISFAGDTPVVEWVEIQQWNRNLESRVSSEPSAIFLKPSLTVFIARSASPLDTG